MLRFTLTLPSAFSKAFKHQARRYWAIDGGVVGDLLRFDQPQTLAQLQVAYQLHYGVYTHCRHTFAEYLAHSLFRLAEHGFARIEPSVPLCPADTPLAFRLALPRPQAAARSAWPAHGRLVGRILSVRKPMTLDQVVAAGRQVAAGWPEESRAVTPMTMAHSLLELSEAGIVEVLQVEMLP